MTDEEMFKAMDEEQELIPKPAVKQADGKFYPEIMFLNGGQWAVSPTVYNTYAEAREAAQKECSLLRVAFKKSHAEFMKANYKVAKP